ncbi:MAG: hypothetical protein ACHQXA_06955 [Gemmatimonadales bacterium]
MADQPNPPFDRAQLERIIRRAAELQTGEHEIGEELSRDDVLKLGRDVGIPTRYLEQAMVEERVRVPTAALEGFWNELAGPATTQAMRVIRGDPAKVQRALTGWMDEHELLSVAREQPGRLLWEPVGGFQAAVRRSVAAVGGTARPFMLARTKRVTAEITALEAGYCHVTLVADTRKARSGFIGGAAVLAGFGLLASVVLGVLHAWFPIAMIPLPLGLAAGYAALRQYVPVPARANLGLERALDALEQADDHPPAALPPGRPGLLDTMLGEVRKALK